MIDQPFRIEGGHCGGVDLAENPFDGQVRGPPGINPAVEVDQKDGVEKIRRAHEGVEILGSGRGSHYTRGYSSHGNCGGARYVETHND